jgi:alanyl-tRNA synthetase
MNELIQMNEPTEITFMTKEESKALGVKAGPDEKYGAEVRVVKVGPEVELCCGTHVQRTGDIGYFCILKESAIRAGTRRIEAVVGMEAVKYGIGCNNILKNLARTLNVGIDKIEEAFAQKLQQKKAVIQAAQAEQHEISDSTVLIYSKNGDLNQLIKKANEYKKYNTTCMFNIIESKTEFAIISKTGSAKQWFDVIKASISASGGGKDSFIRGGIPKEVSLEEILGIAKSYK